MSFWLRAVLDSGRRNPGLARAAVGLGALAPLAALANPTGGQVVGGSATISTPNPNATVVKQTSQNAAINWQTFSVGSNQYVQFIQPDSSAIVLNRVIGSNPSSIFGNITANGQVFLINPNGILFAPGASLDVAGLVASTQDISTSDFMAGRYQFLKGSGALDAAVVNQGAITTTPNGYVVLAGDYVENDGVIQAQSGRVLLAAGGGTTLTLDKNNGLISYSIDGATLARLAGAKNAGDISAAGGTVIMTADVANALTATAVNNSGFIAARSIQSRDGVIVLAATGGDIENSGTLDASASEAGVAGGTVILRGNGTTELAPSSKIEAGGDGAKGGFIELSGHRLHVAGLTDTGAGGMLYLDPTTIKIVAGGASGLGTGAINSIGTGYLTGQLSTHNVTLVAGQSITDSGATGLNINPTGGSGNLALKIGTVTAGTGGSLAGAGCVLHGICQPGSGDTFHPTAGGTISLAGVTIKVRGGFTASASQGNVILGNVSAANGVVRTIGRSITAGSLQGKEIVIQAGSGAVNLGSLTATSAFPASAATVGGLAVYINDPRGNVTLTSGAKIMASHGGVTINGDRVSLGSISAGGAVTVVAHGSAEIGAAISAPGKLLKGRSVNLQATAPIGGSINVGDVHATGGSVSMSVSATRTGSGSAGIVAGNLTAFGGVNLSQTARRGNIRFGNISAGGLVQAHTVGLGISASGANISGGTIVTSGGVQMLTDISVTGGRGGNVNLRNVTGNYISVNARAGSGAHISVASLTATGTTGADGISLYAHANAGASLAGGNITVNGKATAAAGGFSANAFGGSDSGGIITVNGNINVGGLVKMLAVNDGTRGAFINVQNVNGKFITMSASGAHNGDSAARITTGALTATGTATSISPSVGVNVHTVMGNGKISINGGVLATGGAANIMVRSGSGSRAITVGNASSSYAAGKISAQRAHIAVNGPGSAGKIDIGALTTLGVGANGSTSIREFGHSGSGHIVVHGNVNVSGNFLTIEASGSAGAGQSVSVTGNIHATGAFDNVNLTAASAAGAKVQAGNIVATGAVNIDAQGGSLAAGRIQVGSISGGRVSLRAFGGGISGGHIQAGSLVATGSVGISASHAGTSAGPAVQTGAITGAYVHVSLFGEAPVLKAQSITATGPSTGCACESGPHGTPGYITVNVSQSTPNSHASISVAGRVKSSHGAVSMGSTGGNYVGAIKIGGAVTAGKTVNLTATTINVGGSVSAGSSVKLLGVQSALNSTSIKVTGLVTGNKINVTESFTSAAIQGGSIDLVGGASATGTVLGQEGIVIKATTSAPKKMQITTGGLKAAGGDIVITQRGQSGSVSITGPINNSGSGVVIDQEGRGGINAGSITAGGAVTLNAFNSSGGSNAGITVNGNIIAGSGIGIFTSVGGAGGNITVLGGLTANSGNIDVETSDSNLNGGNIKITGAVNATSGSVRLATLGGGASGANITVGNVSAGLGVSINAHYIGTVSAGASHVKVQTGTLTGEFVDVKVTGPAPIFQAAGITANGASGHSCECGNGYVKAQLFPLFSPSTGSISITGPVKSVHGNVTLNAANGTITDSSGAAGKITAGLGITVTGGQIQLGSLSAGDLIAVTASGAAHADSITVNGNIQAPGVRLQAFTAGANGGNVTVNGNITSLTAPSPSFFSGGVQVAANAGSSHSGGNINITGNVTAASRGVFLNAHGGGANGGNISVGNISASGSGVSINARYNGSAAGFTVKTGVITAGFINVGLAGKAPKFSAAGLAGQGMSCECSANVSVRLTDSSFSPEASASINITGSVTAVAHGVKLDAGFGVLNMNSASINAASSGNVNLRGGQLHLGAVSGGAVKILASASNGGSITAGNITATAGNISASANRLVPSFHIQRGTVTTGDLSATGNITVFGTTVSVGGVNAGGTLRLVGSGTSAKPASVTASKPIVFGKFGFIAASGSSGSVNVGNVTATGGSLSIFAEGKPGHPGTITAGSLSAKNYVEILTSNTGIINVGKVSAADSFVSMNGAAITINGPVTAGSFVSFHATGAVKVTGAVSAGSFVEMRGAQISTGPITAGSQFGVTLPGHLTPVSAGFLRLFANSSGGPASINVAGAIHARSASISATGMGATITLGNVTTTPGNIKINAKVLAASQSGNVTAGSLAASQVAVKASHGAMTLGNLSTVPGGASLSAGGSLTLTSTGNIDLNGDTLIAGKAIHLLAGGSISISNVSLTDSAFSASAGNNLTVSVTGNLNLAGQKAVAGKALNLSATGTVELGNAVIGGSAVNITAAAITNSSAGGSITAGGGALKAIGGAIGLKGETLHLTAGTGLLLSAHSSVDLGAVTASGGGKLTVQAGAGVNAASITYSAGGLQITAAGPLVLTNATINAAGNIALHASSMALAGAALKASGPLTVQVAHGLGLGNATLSGSAVDITAGGGITDSSAAVTLAAGAGGLNLKAGGDITLNGQVLRVSGGDATFSAAGNISLVGDTLGAGSVHMVAAGSEDLSGITLTASKTVQLVANQDIILSGVNITANTFIADASGTIHNGGGPGTLTANGLALVAGKNINMTSTQISIGTGSVSSVHADTTLLQELAAFNIGPANATLNGAFIAGGSVALGGLTITGHYLELQGSSVAILGKVTVPVSGFLVQVVPIDTTAAIGVEDQPAATQAFNISNQAFLSLFPGATIAVGDDVESGAVFIGANGAFTLAGNTNLFFDTTGPVTGLNLITSTGLVTTLETFIAATTNNVVTTGEIDPSAGSGTNTGLGDETDKKHLGQGGLGGGGQPPGTISNDSGESGVCH